MKMKKLVLILVTLILTIAKLFAQSDPGEEAKAGKSINCGGVERWDVKVLTDSKVNTINFNPINTTVSGIISIVTPPPSTSMPRYDGVEDKTYQLVCKITIKKNEEGEA